MAVWELSLVMFLLYMSQSASVRWRAGMRVCMPVVFHSGLFRCCLGVPSKQARRDARSLGVLATTACIKQHRGEEAQKGVMPSLCRVTRNEGLRMLLSKAQVIDELESTIPPWIERFVPQVGPTLVLVEAA
jgi:hypothetical protein